MYHYSLKRALRAACALSVAGIIAGCGVSNPAPSAKTASRPADRRPAPRVLTKPVPSGITYSRLRMADGSLITMATFHGSVRYVLHNGSQDPGGLAGPVSAGSAITGPSRRQLLAAFNGGFKMTSLAGGYMQEGRVAKPIRDGLASLVIDRSGRARIGVWGRDVPASGEAVYSVRQNLWPLVVGGQPTAESALWWRWGGTIGHAEYVARSALGQNAAGDLMYAASMSTTPADLAAALARAGARVAMELDINPEWVQMDAASRPGGPLKARVPGQHRPADQYLVGWTRDFIAVLAPA